MAAGSDEREPPDPVKRARFFTERINKERQWQPVFTQYTVNPHRPVHMVARKPMSWHENIQQPIDADFLNILHHAAQVPRQKYSEPQTASQEIGWNSTPLVPFNRNDIRFYFPLHTTEITILPYPAPRGGKPKGSTEKKGESHKKEKGKPQEEKGKPQEES